MSRELTRKDLLRSVVGFLREVGEQVEGPRPFPRERLLRPPGALAPDTAYLSACTTCEACVTACPHGSIFMAEAVAGVARKVAVIAPERMPCYLCDGLPCVIACTPGALRHPGSARLVRIGVAQVGPRLCRAFRAEPCDLCVRACPYPEVAIRTVGGRPLVVPDACTGCGLCVAACPERPRAVRVHAERTLMPGSRLPVLLPPSGRLSG